MFTFTLNAIFFSLSLSNVCTIRFDIEGGENCIEKLDNVGKMGFTHEIFINIEVVKWF